MAGGKAILLTTGIADDVDATLPQGRSAKETPLPRGGDSGKPQNQIAGMVATSWETLAVVRGSHMRLGTND